MNATPNHDLVERERRIDTGVAAPQGRRRQTERSALTATVIDSVVGWLADLREQAIEWTDRIDDTSSAEVLSAGFDALLDIERETSAFVEAVLGIGDGARDREVRNELDDALLLVLGELTGAQRLAMVLEAHGDAASAQEAEERAAAVLRSCEARRAGSERLRALSAELAALDEAECVEAPAGPVVATLVGSLQAFIAEQREIAREGLRAALEGDDERAAACLAAVSAQVDRVVEVCEPPAEPRFDWGEGLWNGLMDAIAETEALSVYVDREGGGLPIDDVVEIVRRGLAS